MDDLLDANGTFSMKNSNNNRLKAIGEVVSVDAWHAPFDGTKGTADLHVDVSFSQARIGGDAASKVSFRLSLRRADLILILPPQEPVRVVRKSVARESRIAEVTRRTTLDNTSNYAASGSISSRVGLTSAQLEVSGEANGAATRASFEHTEVTERLALMMVRQSMTADGSYRWEITPHSTGVLNGKPWDAVQHPRVKLQDTRKEPSHGLSPVVRLEIRCAREDLIVEDIKINDEIKWSWFAKSSYKNNKIAAAESLIRDILIREGLEFESVEERFASITLLSTIAEDDGTR